MHVPQPAPRAQTWLPVWGTLPAPISTQKWTPLVGDHQCGSLHCSAVSFISCARLGLAALSAQQQREALHWHVTNCQGPIRAKPRKAIPPTPCCLPAKREAQQRKASEESPFFHHALCTGIQLCSSQAPGEALPVITTPWQRGPTHRDLIWQLCPSAPLWGFPTDHARRQERGPLTRAGAELACLRSQLSLSVYFAPETPGGWTRPPLTRAWTAKGPERDTLRTLQAIRPNSLLGPRWAMAGSWMRACNLICAIITVLPLAACRRELLIR